MLPSYPNKLLINPQTFDFVLTTDIPTLVQQRLTIRLMRFLGEWYLDTTAGVPYFQQIFVKNPNMSAVESYIKKIILGTKDVVSLQSFQFSFDAALRKATIVFSVSLSNGSSLNDITMVL